MVTMEMNPKFEYDLVRQLLTWTLKFVPMSIKRLEIKGVMDLPTCYTDSKPLSDFH